MVKRITSLFLALAMCLSALPVQVFATEAEIPQVTAEQALTEDAALPIEDSSGTAIVDTEDGTDSTADNTAADAAADTAGDTNDDQGDDSLGEDTGDVGNDSTGDGEDVTSAGEEALLPEITETDGAAGDVTGSETDGATEGSTNDTPGDVSADEEQIPEETEAEEMQEEILASSAEAALGVEEAFTPSSITTNVPTYSYANLGTTVDITLAYTGALPEGTFIRVKKSAWNPETGTTGLVQLTDLPLDASGTAHYTPAEPGTYYLYLMAPYADAPSGYIEYGVQGYFTLYKGDHFITGYDQNYAIPDTKTTIRLESDADLSGLTFSYYLRYAYYDENGEWKEAEYSRLENTSEASFTFTLPASLNPQSCTLTTLMYDSNGMLLHCYSGYLSLYKWYIEYPDLSGTTFYAEEAATIPVIIHGTLPESHPFTVYRGSASGDKFATGVIADSKITFTPDVYGDYAICTQTYESLDGYYDELNHYDDIYLTVTDPNFDDISISDLYADCTYQTYNVNANVPTEVSLVTIRNPADLTIKANIFRGCTTNANGIAIPDRSTLFTSLTLENITSEQMPETYNYLVKGNFSFTPDALGSWMIETLLYSKSEGRAVARDYTKLEIVPAETFLFRSLERTPNKANYINAESYVTLYPVYEGAWPEGITYRAYTKSEEVLYRYNDITEFDKEYMDFVGEWDTANGKEWNLYLPRSGDYMIEVLLGDEVIGSTGFLAITGNCYMVEPFYPYENRLSQYQGTTTVGNKASFSLSMDQGAQTGRMTCNFYVYRWVDYNWTDDDYSKIDWNNIPDNWVVQDLGDGIMNIYEFVTDIPTSHSGLTFSFWPDEPGFWGVDLQTFVDEHPVQYSQQSYIVYDAPPHNCKQGTITERVEATETTLGWNIRYTGCTICKQPMPEGATMPEAEAEEYLAALREASPLYYAVQILTTPAGEEAQRDVTGRTLAYDLSAQPTFNAGSLPTSEFPIVTWRSSNTAVATVDAYTGEVTFVKPGKVTITATGGGKSAQVTLVAYDRILGDRFLFSTSAPEGYEGFYSVTNGRHYLQSSGKMLLTVSADGRPVNLVAEDSEDVGVNLKITRGAEFGTLDPVAGVFTATRPNGTVEIKATMKGDRQNRSAIITIFTTPCVPTNVWITTDEGTAVIGEDGYVETEGFLLHPESDPTEPKAESLHLRKSVSDRSYILRGVATNPLGERFPNTIGEITWTSSNTRVATVAESAGIVTLKIPRNAVGTATIKAVSKRNNQAIDTLTVNIADYTPTLPVNRATMNSWLLDAAVTLDLNAAQSNAVTGVTLVNRDGSENPNLAASYLNGVLTIDTSTELLNNPEKNYLDNKDYGLRLYVQTAHMEQAPDERGYPFDLVLKVANSAPRIDIRQPKRLNYKGLDTTAQITVTASGYENLVCAWHSNGGSYFLQDDTKQIFLSYPLGDVRDTRGTMTFKADNYRHIPDKTFTVATEAVVPTFRMNSYHTDSYLRITGSSLTYVPEAGMTVLDTAPQVYAYNPATRAYDLKSEELKAEYIPETYTLRLLPDDSVAFVKNGTCKVEVELPLADASGTPQPRRYEISLTVANSAPKITVTQSHKLNCKGLDTSAQIFVSTTSEYIGLEYEWRSQNGSYYLNKGTDLIFRSPLGDNDRDTRGTMTFTASNFRYIPDQAFTVATESVVPVFRMNSYFSDEYLLKNGSALTYVPEYGVTIQGDIQVYEFNRQTGQYDTESDELRVVCQDNILRLLPGEDVLYIKNGTRKVELRVPLADSNGDILYRRHEISVTVANSAPRITIRQPKRLNYKGLSPIAEITVTAEGFADLKYTWRSNDGSYFLKENSNTICINPENFNFRDTRGTMEFTDTNYRYIPVQAFTVATEAVNPAFRMNSYFSDEYLLANGGTLSYIPEGEMTVTGIRVYEYNSKTRAYETGDNISENLRAVYDPETQLLRLLPMTHLNNGTRKVEIEVTLQNTEGSTETRRYEISVTVANSAPRVTIRQTKTLNFLAIDDFALVDISVAGMNADDFTVEWYNDRFNCEDNSTTETIRTCKFWLKDAAAANSTSKNIRIINKDYRYIPEASLNVGTTNRITSFVVNTYLDDAGIQSMVTYPEVNLAGTGYTVEVCDKVNNVWQTSESWTADIVAGKMVILPQCPVTRNSRIQLKVLQGEELIKTYEVDMVVRNSAPRVTVRQTKTLNYLALDDFALVDISVAGMNATQFELETWNNTRFDCKDYSDNYAETDMTRTYKFREISETNPNNTRGSIVLRADGYRYIPPVNFGLGTSKSIPRVTLNAYLDDEALRGSVVYPQTDFPESSIVTVRDKINNAWKDSVSWTAAIENGRMVILPKDHTAKGGRIQLTVTPEGGTVRTFEVDMTVRNSAPRVTVRQTKTLNLWAMDPYGLVDISVAGMNATQFELETWNNTRFDCKDCSDNYTETDITRTYKFWEDDETAPNNTRGSIVLKVDGYRYIPPINFGLRTSKSIPKITLNTYLNDESLKASVAYPQMDLPEGSYNVTVFDLVGRNYQPSTSWKATIEENRMVILPLTDAPITRNGRIRLDVATSAGDAVASFEADMVVRNSAPRVTVRQTKTLNLWAMDPYGLVDISVAGMNATQFELDTWNNTRFDCKDYSGNYTETDITRTYKFWEISETNPNNTRGSIVLKATGYRYIPPINFGLRTSKSIPKITLNTYLDDEALRDSVAYPQMDLPEGSYNVTVFDLVGRNYQPSTSWKAAIEENRMVILPLTDAPITRNGRIRLDVATLDGKEIGSFEADMVVRNSAPRVTVRQTKTLNFLAFDDFALVDISIAGMTAEQFSVSNWYNERFNCQHSSSTQTTDTYKFRQIDEKGSNSTRQNLILQADGYRYIPPVSLRLGTTSRITKITLNTYLTDDRLEATVQYPTADLPEDSYTVKVFDLVGRNYQPSTNWKARMEGGRVIVLPQDAPVTRGGKIRLDIMAGESLIKSYQADMVIRNSVPRLSVSTQRKLNLNNPLSFANIRITANGGIPVTGVTLADTDFKCTLYSEGNCVIDRNDGKQADTRGILLVDLEGYRYRISQNYSIPTEKVNIVAVPYVNTLTLYRSVPGVCMGTSIGTNFQKVGIASCGTKNIISGIHTWYDKNLGFQACFANQNVPIKAGTYTFTLATTATNGSTLRDIAIKVRVLEKPSVKLDSNTLSPSLSGAALTVPVYEDTAGFVGFREIMDGSNFLNGNAALTFTEPQYGEGPGSETIPGMLTVSLTPGTTLRAGSRHAIKLTPVYRNGPYTPDGPYTLVDGVPITVTIRPVK